MTNSFTISVQDYSHQAKKIKINLIYLLYWFQLVSENITNLEREKRDLGDKLKRESESLDKLKKLNTELSVSKSAAESTVSDLNEKLSALSEDRNLLERELAKQQSQLQVKQFRIRL